LTRERLRLTDEMQKKTNTSHLVADEEEDELEAFMKKNESSLQLAHQKQLGA